MIQRLTPDVGYLPAEMFEALGISQLVIAGGLVHWSGIIAAQAEPTGFRLDGADSAGQLTVILEKLDAMLAAVGSDRTQIVSMTFYSTAIDDLSVALGRIYTPWVGQHRPALTTIGVARLALPQALLEVQGCAVVPELQ
ncbi:RidA family protein [Mycolicibacter minnesotensis]